jgi:ABC-type branched-subunit amino acid transport system ATPase component/MFS family permease
VAETVTVPAAPGPAEGTRELIPTEREVELGRQRSTVSFSADPYVVVAEEGYRDPGLLRRFLTVFRGMDPRTLPRPLLPLIALGILGTVQQWDANIYSIVSPRIEADLGLNLAVLSGTITTVGLITQIMAPYFGYLADRLNRVWMMRVGSLVMDIGYLAMGFVMGAPTLIGARIMQGFGAAVVQPPSFTVMNDVYPVMARIRVIFFMFAAAPVITIVGTAAGGYLAAAYGWRAVLTGIGVIGLLATLLLSFIKPSPRGFFDRKFVGISDELAMTPQPPASWRESWRSLWRVGSIRWQWIASPFLAVATTVGFGFVPLYFAQRYGLGTAGQTSVRTIGQVIGVVSLLVLAPYGQRIAQNRPRFLVVAIAFEGLVNAVTFLLLNLVNNLDLAVGITAIQQALGAMLFPLQFGLILMVIPPRMRGFGIQTLNFFGLFGTLFITFAGVELAGNDLGALLRYVIPASLVGAALILPALRTADRDVASALTAAAADVYALEARERGQNVQLVVRDLQVDYDGVQVLFGVDLDVAAGEMVAVLGTNGAGKSTLLRAVAGTQEASGGAIFFEGNEITHRPPHENVHDGVVMVPGGQAVLPGVSVRDHLSTAAFGAGTVDEELRTRLARVFELFPILSERANEPGANLSGGEQQMLALAQAFLMRPRLLMIDELSLGLAPAVVEALLEVLREINANGTTVLLVEQSLNVALTIADRAIFMDKGTVHFDGSTSELLSRPELVRSIFLGGATGGGLHSWAIPRLATEEALLTVSDVSVSFGGVQALAGVTVSVESGEVVGIIGPNGAGKTTLFDVISGVVLPDSGTVQFKGAQVNKLGPDLRAARGLSRSFQNARLFPSLTVRECIAVAASRHVRGQNPIAAAAWLPPARDAERKLQVRVDDLLELLGLGGYADKFVGELSTGTRRAVEIGCIMMQAPDALLLDEPSSGLAQAEIENLGPVIQRVVRETGCGVLVIEHDLPLIVSVSHRLIAMELGRIIAVGKPEEVMSDPGVQRAYLSASKEVLLRSGSTLSTALAAAGLTAVADSPSSATRAQKG